MRRNDKELQVLLNFAYKVPNKQTLSDFKAYHSNSCSRYTSLLAVPQICQTQSLLMALALLLPLCGMLFPQTFADPAPSCYGGFCSAETTFLITSLKTPGPFTLSPSLLYFNTGHLSFHTGSSLPEFFPTLKEQKIPYKLFQSNEKISSSFHSVKITKI